MFFFRETCFPEHGLLHLASDFNVLRFIIVHLEVEAIRLALKSPDYSVCLL